ncbi:hypothetical protein A3Q56_06987 [Intoshia linei]|uniref:Uncharacterized protein n=1 Tax=Intoshia linei TaxID=1819745 RepID=A0A177ATG5_9BILA|nr:hypothetical protein A3Q56_06987 [Intoshia linei]
MLIKDMKRRFCDIFELEVCDWMINPFSANVIEVDVNIQEELLEMKYDTHANLYLIIMNMKNYGKIQKTSLFIKNFYFLNKLFYR